MADPAQLLPFAQLDLAGALGPSDGRYVVRGSPDPDAPPDVLVLRTLGASRSRSRLRRGKPRAVEPEAEPAPLTISRVTLIKSIPFETAAAADEWLATVSADDELSRGLAAELTHTLNRALLAHRVAAPDPYAADVDPAGAVAVRLGYGSGQEVADGRWSAAHELAEDRQRSPRAEVMDTVGAQERMAAVLGGRSEVAPSEALLVEAERAAAERREATSALLLAAALDALRASGHGDGGGAAEARKLRERTHAGAELAEKELREALRAGRRAIRAAHGSG